MIRTMKGCTCDTGRYDEQNISRLASKQRQQRKNAVQSPHPRLCSLTATRINTHTHTHTSAHLPCNTILHDTSHH